MNSNKINNKVVS